MNDSVIVDALVPEVASEADVYLTVASSNWTYPEALRSVQCLPLTENDGRNVTSKLCMISLSNTAAASALVAAVAKRELLAPVNILFAVVSVCGARNATDTVCGDTSHKGSGNSGSNTSYAAAATAGSITTFDFQGSKVGVVLGTFFGVNILAIGISIWLVKRGRDEFKKVTTAEAFQRAERRLNERRRSSAGSVAVARMTYGNTQSLQSSGDYFDL